MKSKIALGTMLTLLLIGMLTLAFNIGLAEAETYYYNFNITVTPEFPSTLDEINMTVSFDTASISYEITFGPVSQVSNEFSVDIDIYVPESVFWMIGYASHTYSLGKLPAGSYSFVATVRVSGYGYGVYEHRKSFAVSPVVMATVNVDPDTLNLKSKGRWITCYIELPKGYNGSDINRTTILLNDTIPVDPFWVDNPLESVVGDYDDDGVLDLMVKFSRAAVIEYLLGQNITCGKVTLTVIGELYNGPSFEGSDMIRVKMPSDVNSDCDECESNLYSADECVDNYKLVVPEFPSFLILPLFMIVTLLAVIVYRKKRTI